MAAFRASALIANGQSSGTTTVNAIIPASAVVGDVAVVSLTASSGSGTFTTPTGWTLTSGPDRISSPAQTAYLFTKTLIAGDPGSTIPFVFSESQRIVGTLSVFSGVTLTGVTFVPRFESADATTTTLPTLASVPAAAMVVAVWTRRAGSTTAAVVTVPSPWTAGPESRTALGSSPNMTSRMGYRVAPSAGSYGGESTTTSLSTSGVNYVLNLADTGGGTPATVTGVTATVSVSAAAGQVTGGDVDIVGVAATVSASAPAGAASAELVVDGETAIVTVSAEDGSTEVVTSPLPYLVPPRTGKWRYLAQQMTGDGQGDWWPVEISMAAPGISDALSAPPVATSRIASNVAHLKGPDGEPLFKRWKTAIYAEADGEIRAGWLLRDASHIGPEWELDLVGFTAYPKDMPYDGEEAFVGADPLDMFRHIWAHLQGKPGGNLGLVIDSTTSPVRVGTPEQTNEFTTSDGTAVSFESGPRKFNWWTTKDLAAEIDDLASETPFDWQETHAWSGEHVAHRIRLGYPRIGGFRPDLKIVYGENTKTRPEVRSGKYANAVIVLGAGEGRARVRGYAGVTDDRLRRVETVEDKSMTSVAQANALAARHLAAARGEYVVEEVVVLDHRNAPIQAIQLGDYIPYYAKLEGITLDHVVRVVRRTTNPDHSELAKLTVVRADLEAPR